MGRTPVVKLDGQQPTAIEVAPEDVVYTPSEAERIAKAAFWQAWSDDPTQAADEIPVARIVQLTGESRLTKWFNKPLFRDWFMNKDIYVHKARALAEMGQDLIWGMMKDETVRPDLRAKLALEAMKNYAAVLAASKPQSKFLDEDINKMTPDQLREFLASAGAK